MTIEGGKEASLVERLEEILGGVTEVCDKHGSSMGFMLADTGPGSYHDIESTAEEAAARIETLERERDEARAACRAGLATLKGVGVTAGARVLMLSRQVALDDARRAPSSSQGGGG